MKWLPPSRPEGKVWLDQFNKRFKDWLVSQQSDKHACSDFIQALRYLIEREPECSPFVANLASTILDQHLTFLGINALDLAEIGLTAERMWDQKNSVRPLLKARLFLKKGLILYRLGRFVEAEKESESAVTALDVDLEDTLKELHQLTLAEALLVRASSLEALLEYGTAFKLYKEVRDITSSFVADRELLGKAFSASVFMDFSDDAKITNQVLHSLIQLLWRKLSSMLIRASVGATWCSVFEDQTELNSLFESLLLVIEKHGLLDASPLALGFIARHLELEQTTRFIQCVSTTAQKVSLPVADYEAVLYAAAACQVADLLTYRALVQKSRQALVQVVDPLCQAAAVGLLIVSASKEWKQKIEYLKPISIDLFSNSLEAIGKQGDHRINEPRSAAVFDEAIIFALDTIANELDESGIWQSRHSLAKLLDFSLTGPSKLDTWLPYSQNSAFNYKLATIAMIASDKIGRLKFALKDWSDAIALIIRSIGANTLFICVTGEDFVVAKSDQTYSEAANNLTKLLAQQIDAMELQIPPSDEKTFIPMASAVYDSIPKSIRQRIDKSSVILLNPDYRTGGSQVPFEMFYDGHNWLGVAKVVTRFPSLSTLLCCAEGVARQEKNLRTLMLAVSNAENESSLIEASKETELLRVQLEDEGWDAPRISEERITAKFIMDRLPYTRHLHIAAHGVGGAPGRDDALVLSRGERLFSSNLRGWFYPRVPTVFLNTCELGSTKWAGGGRSRGIAQAFIEAGSPAVVANLLPVEDEATFQLAKAFYEAAHQEDFGEALRFARRKLVSDPSTSSPVFWASTVLMGDPHTTLKPRIHSDNISDKLLDSYMKGDQSNSREFLLDVSLALSQNPDDLRLAASVDLLSEMSKWSKPDRTLRSSLAEACRICFELNHLSSAATIAFILSETYDETDDIQETLRVVEGSLELAESLEYENKDWSKLTNILLARWMKLKQGDRNPTINVHGGGDAAEQEETKQIGETILDIQLSLKAREIRRGTGLSFRDPEISEKDVLWNSILANRTSQFESMPEIFAFAKQVVRKLEAIGASFQVPVENSATFIVGFMKWLWDSQNVANLQTEMAEGQTGALSVCINSYRTNLSNLGIAWFDKLAQFPIEMRELLNSLNDLPYDANLYVRIDEIMQMIQNRAQSLLSEVATKDSAKLPDAAAWILGCLIRENTFSYLDGSVPEDICERLTRIHDDIDSDSEKYFYSWLERGFQSIREHVFDELEKWKYGLS